MSMVTTCEATSQRHLYVKKANVAAVACFAFGLANVDIFE